MTTGNSTATADRLSAALVEIEQKSPHKTDGKWLEHLTANCAPLIAEWDVSRAWLWQDWPDRRTHYLNTPDIGIDVVARRASDGVFIAIQCKSRKLDEQGRGADITKKEFDSFLAASSDELWAERWLIVNGDTRLSGNAGKTVGQKPVTLVNIETDLRKQKDTDRPDPLEPCLHCDGSGDRRTRDCMQAEAIETSVKLLRQHAQANDNGWARGRIILPCGTGKSRIALRIIEELTEPGQVSTVLCPISVNLFSVPLSSFRSGSIFPFADGVFAAAPRGHGISRASPPGARAGECRARSFGGPG